MEVAVLAMDPIQVDMALLAVPEALVTETTINLLCV